VIEWTWDDGWILAATCLVSRPEGAELSEIIAAADAINHAIPTAGELSKAFTSLVSYGILVRERGCHTVSETYLPAIRAALQTRGGLFKSADKCLKWLQKLADENVALSQVLVTEAEVNAAQKEYSRLVRHLNAKRQRKPR
jgi:hypothetical protein